LFFWNSPYNNQEAPLGHSLLDQPEDTAMRQMVLAFSLLSGLACGPRVPNERPLVVFAAASTRESLEEIAAQFQERHGSSVQLNFGASSILARQIREGATADLFLSADEICADELDKEQLVEGRTTLLTNRLVVVVPEASTLKVQELKDLAGPEVRRLALAEEQVPAGRYARQALNKVGLWEQVRERVVVGGDVRAALQYVAREEAEAGIVYATDALGNRQVRVALPISPELHDAIRYPLVVLKKEQPAPGLQAFLDYLKSSAGREIFEKHGFATMPPTKP
jgi:molybdate transport system substrate-binding protein